MALKATVQEGKGLQVEAGTYTIRCLDVKEDHLANSQFGNGDVYRWTFEVQDGDGPMEDEEGEPISLDGVSDRKLTPNNKTTRWVEAFGIGLEVGDEVDLEDCIDKRCLAMIGVKDTDKGKFNTIDTLMPLPKGKVAAPKGNGNKGAEPEADLLTAFWKRVRAIGLEPGNIAPYVDNDLRTLASKTADELEAICKEVGA